jgi:hypothetical protein
MAALITGADVSKAWLRALEYLLEEGGKAVNLSVAIESSSEDDGIRSAFDAFLASRYGRKGRPVWAISTVANTLFPQAFYQPKLGAAARDHLYEMHEEAMTVHTRTAEKDNYFNRLVAWPGTDGPINQLDRLVEQLARQVKRGGALGSASELGLSHPEDAELLGGDLRVHTPGRDRQLMGFPCLSHISATVEHRVLHLTALYRNQHFIRRAYGNYLGLARIGEFLATETEVELGEILCVASHADAEIGQGYSKEELVALAEVCRDESAYGRGATAVA